LFTIFNLSFSADISIKENNPSLNISSFFSGIKMDHLSVPSSIYFLYILWCTTFPPLVNFDIVKGLSIGSEIDNLTKNVPAFLFFFS